MLQSGGVKSKRCVSNRNGRLHVSSLPAKGVICWVIVKLKQKEIKNTLACIFTYF